MSHTLRPATAADALAVHTVMMAAGMDPRSSWSRSTVADIEWSLGTGGGFLAILDGAVVGCVGWRPDGFRTLTLNKLAARPEVRGQGVGTALVRAVEEQARLGGYVRVLLAVSQYNLSVVSFYEQLGYAVSSDRYAFAHPGSPSPVVLVKTTGGRP
ncbi:GNAT family N-acetyltransferase [Deinococcus radiomollis]|uniref:GNAT family N-acetyltransferase n=1 Tax=Deinococcus radiomollis TaxID=468916 RepID=UPI0038929BD3